MLLWALCPLLSLPASSQLQRDQPQSPPGPLVAPSTQSLLLSLKCLASQLSPEQVTRLFGKSKNFTLLFLFHQDSSLRTKSKKVETWTEGVSVKVGCKVAELSFRSQDNTATSHELQALGPRSHTTDKLQGQADPPGWAAGSLCSGISRALALKGTVRPEVTKQRYQGK